MGMNRTGSAGLNMIEAVVLLIMRTCERRLRTVRKISGTVVFFAALYVSSFTSPGEFPIHGWISATVQCENRFAFENNQSVLQFY
jgi:hypothetical protein